jgi:hypothetical protein
MPEKIHYEDNIYFLTALVRALNDAVRLNVDADYFADKVLEDTLFIDTSIQRIHGSLKENGHLIRRNAYLHSVMKLKRAYGKLLEDLLATKDDFSTPFETMRPKLRRIAAAHFDDVKSIRAELRGADGVKLDRDMISLDELSFLMTPIDDGDES